VAESARLKAKNMQGQIFLKAVRHLLDPADKNIPRQPFNVEFGTMKGDTVKGTVVCTSSNFNNDTLNFKFTESSETRTVHAQLLFSINGKEVML